MNYADYYRAPLGPKKPSSYQNQFANFRIEPRTLARYKQAYGNTAPAGTLMARYLENNPNAMQGIGSPALYGGMGGFGMGLSARPPVYGGQTGTIPRPAYQPGYSVGVPGTPTYKFVPHSGVSGGAWNQAASLRTPYQPLDPGAEFQRKLQEWVDGGRVGPPPSAPIVNY